MSSTRQSIYLCFFIVLIAAAGLSITQLVHNNSVSSSNTSATLNASSEETQIIDWETASQLMKDCQIKVIFQKHNLEVTLRTHDHQIYQTTQPHIDDIFNLAKKYQGPCDIVQMITE